MKEHLIYALQRVLGFENYLYLFSNFKILTLRKDQKESDFFTFLDLIQPDECVLDIGANIGIMTYFLSKKTRYGKVIAFEPVPENVSTTKKIIEHYKLNNVILIEKALGNKQGKIRMIMPRFGKARKQGLSHVIHNTIDTFNEGTEYTVDIVTLDSIMSEMDCVPRAIKLDVENYEFFVLKGAEQTIKKYLPLIYTELWNNDNRVKCMDLLSTWGYSAYVVIGKNIVSWNPDKHSHQNFIFLPLVSGKKTTNL